jgi:Raf kinase inhibitor-like YbhB/YbcL family protein
MTSSPLWRPASVGVALLALGACHRGDADKAAPAASNAAPTSAGAAATASPTDARLNQLAVRQIDVKEPGVLALTSTAFEAAGVIPDQFSSYGQNVSPELCWSPDKAAKSYVLIVEDPDAPKPEPFVHWVAWNIPASVHELPLGISNAPSSAQPLMQGRNGAGTPLWYGPHPPKGGPHHYHFQLFALDAALALPAGADRNEVVKAMQGHVVAMGDLVGTYQAK